MSSKQIDLSIIIPAYMEAGVITSSLDTLADWLDNHDYGEVEVIVVVADSPDGTANLAASKATRFKHFRVAKPGFRVGKGRDVRFGMYEASGRYRLFMDADLATPLVHLDDVKTAIQNDADVAIAVRDLWAIHDSLLRRLISKLGNISTQLLVLPGLKDTQCGFKVFRSDVAEAVFSRQTMLGWSFDAEILAISRKLGYNITSFEAPDWTDPKAGNMGLVGDSPLHAALTTFKDLIIIRRNLWSRAYKDPSYVHRLVG